MTASHLKSLLLLFWTVWLTIVFATNLCDGLKELGLLGQSWRFASGNFQFLTTTTARYGTPRWLNAVLFGGVIGWEGLAALLFGLTSWDACRRGATASRYLYPAFALGLMLWGGFMIADELCIAYSVEGTHLRLFIAQLVTLLAVVLLPEREQ